MIHPGNRELMIDELAIVHGGAHGDRYCCAGPIDPFGHGNGAGDGLGWLRNLGAGIAGAAGGVAKTIGGIIGL